MKQTIVIVGGGIAGLELVTKLGKKLGKKNKKKIILVDCNLSHTWKPLLHKIATGLLDSNLESVNYFEQSNKNNFTFKLGKLINIDRKNKNITLSKIYNENQKKVTQKEKIKFDILVISIGSITNNFNIQGVNEHCIFLDNVKKANLLHKKIFNLLIHKKIKNKINIVIIGGGPTGVEFSAELVNTIKKLEQYNIKNLHKKNIFITLIEGKKRILPEISKKISQEIHDKLKKLGIVIKTKTFVEIVSKNEIFTKSKETIKSDIIIWTTGIKIPNFMKKIAKLETNEINQLIVKKTLQTTLDDFIFAIGDCASYQEKNKKLFPPRAQSAHQMAKICFKNILLLIKFKKLKNYKYKDHGFLISLSKFATIGQINKFLFLKKIKISGKLAKIIYLSLYKIHLIKIYGFFKTIILTFISIFNKKIRMKTKID